MKNLAMKSMVPALASALLILAAGQAQALSVSITSGFFTMPSNGIILEDFEGQPAGWYETLSTNVGLFTAVGNPGTSDNPFFEVRDYNANGRYNVASLDGKYLDSAGITALSLNLTPGYNNIFFTITNPGTLRGVTTTGSHATFDNIFGDIAANSNNDGSLWFVEIADADYDLTGITWEVNTTNGGANSNDGFSLDSFGTVNSVPEPATALLLGAGLIPLMGYLRRKKKEEV